VDSKYEIVHRIEQIDAIQSILQDLRRSQIHDLETIEATESFKADK
jgi:hypothetical protein